MPAVLELHTPVVDPHPISVCPCAGPPHPGPAESLDGPVPPGADVGDREVPHEEIAHGPARRVGGRWIDANPKERQLVPEATAVCGGQIPGVVPPLDPVLGMTRVIGRQPQHASRLRVPPGGVLLRGDGGCGARGEQREQEGSDAHHSLWCSTGCTAAASRAGYSPAMAVAMNSASEDCSRNRPGT